MSTEFVRRFSSLFTDSDSPQTNMAAAVTLPHKEQQPWSSRIDVDSMIASMASKNPNVKRPHVQLIKQLISSISTTTHDHPVYPVMIREAMRRLNEGMGCRKEEITEFIAREYDVSPVVNCAKVVFELDRLLKSREIGLTAENRYVVRRDENENENEDGNGGDSFRGLGRKRGSRGGRGWRGSKVRKVVEENVVAEEEEGDKQNVSDEEEEEEECGDRIDGSSEEEIGKEKLPPGFEGIVDRNEEWEKLVGCKEVERIEISQGDDGRNELCCERRTEEECVQGAGDGGDVERAVDMREAGGNEDSGQLQEPLEGERCVEATALVILPSKEVEAKGPTAQLDSTLNAKIVSCTGPLEIESVEKQRTLQERHERVLNTIGDFSGTVSKLCEENLQSNEAGNKKHLFDEEHYMELLKKAEAVQLALKDVIKVKAVDVSNHTGTEVVAVPDSVLGTVSESEIPKETRRGKRKRESKHRKRARDVDTLLKSCSEQEASAIIQNEEFKRPTKIKFTLSGWMPPVQQNESSERQIVCGLEKQDRKKRPRGRRTSQPGPVHSVVSEDDVDWTTQGPRCKRPRSNGPNVNKSTQARKQVRTPAKELKMNWPTAGDRTWISQQPQGQGSSQSGETSVGVPAELLPSQHENELQNHGKALPIKLALEPGTGRIIYIKNPRKEQGSQIQGQGGHDKDQTSDDFRDGGACLDHKEPDDKQQAEGSNESIPKLKLSSGVTDNSLLDLQHQSNDQGKQPQVQDQISNQNEEILKLQSDVAKQQNHDGQHQMEGSHESIPKLNPNAGVIDHSSVDLEHQSNEQGKQPQVQDQTSNQKEEMLKLQSDGAKQQNHDGQHQMEGSHEGILKLNTNAGVTDHSSLVLEHQSNEQGKPPQVGDKISNQPDEMLKLQSDASNQQNHDDQQQVEGTHESIPKLKPCAGAVDNSLHSEHQSEEPRKLPQVEDQTSSQPEETLNLQSDVFKQQNHDDQQQVEGTHESIPKLKPCAGAVDNSLHSEHQSDEPGKLPQVEDQTSDQPEEMLKPQVDVSNQPEQLQHVQVEGSNQHEEQHQCQSELRNQLEQQQTFEGQRSDQQVVQQQSGEPVSSQQEQHRDQLLESHGDNQQVNQKPVQPQTSDVQEQGQGSDQEGVQQRSGEPASSQQEQHQQKLLESHGGNQQVEQKPVQPQTSDVQDQGQGFDQQGVQQRSGEPVSSQQEQHQEQLLESLGDDLQVEQKPVQPQTSDVKEPGQGSTEQEVEPQQSPSVSESANSAALTTSSSHKDEQEQSQQQWFECPGRLTRSKAEAVGAVLSPLSFPHHKQRTPGSSRRYEK